MKKLIAILLTLLMITATASAAEWEAGLGPNKPYADKPEVDFNVQLGYMMFHPNSNISVAGTNKLFIYLPREDVKVGTAHLTLRSADQGEEFRVAMDDTTYVTQRAPYDIELIGLMWGSGTCFEITLPISLRVATTYYVDMEDNCIVDAERGRGNKAFTSNDQDGWRFVTYADFGVSALEYRRPTGDGAYESGILQPKAGDEVRFDVVIGGDAASAAVFVYGDMMFDKIHFTESGEVVGTVMGDNPDWEIVFLDTEDMPAGNELEQHVVDWLAF